jgi:predicted dehydrogenase
VYAVGLAHWLTGRRTESVQAVTGNYFFAEHAKHDVEDFGAVLMGMQGGVTATAIGGRYGWTSHPKGGSQKIVLYGSKGTQTFDAWRPRIEVFSEEADFAMPDVHPFDPMGMWGSTQREAGVMPKRRWMTPFDERGTMVRDVAHFVDCVDRNIEPEMNAAFAAPLTEVLMAAYASVAKGKAVTLPIE